VRPLYWSAWATRVLKGSGGSASDRTGSEITVHETGNIKADRHNINIRNLSISFESC